MLEHIRVVCNKVINRYAYANKFFIGDRIINQTLTVPNNLSDEAYGSFYGAIMPSYGTNVVFIPKEHPHIGLYNCASDTYSDGPLHSAGSKAFHKGVDIGSGIILMCPYHSPVIGLYNYISNTYTQGPSVTDITRSSNTLGRFIDCIKIGSYVYLIPAGCNNIGIYDIVNNIFRTGAQITTNIAGNKFASAVQISNTEILLVPYANYNFYRYNFITDTITQDTYTNRVLNYFGPSIRYRDVVICSMNNGGFLTYNIKDKSIISYIGEKSYTYNNPFSELVLYGKNMICVPKRSNYLGEYQYSTNIYTRGNLYNPILTDNSYKNFYAGGCLAFGKIIMAPYYATNVGIYRPDSINGT